MQYSDIISIASTKEQFPNAIQWELQNDTPERASKRIDIARQHSWDSHIERLSNIISEALKTKTRQETDLK
jgi:predicted nucleotidyltransferase